VFQSSLLARIPFTIHAGILNIIKDKCVFWGDECVKHHCFIAPLEREHAFQHRGTYRLTTRSLISLSLLVRDLGVDAWMLANLWPVGLVSAGLYASAAELYAEIAAAAMPA